MIELWDWKRDPQPPNKRVVVCRPGLFRGADGDLMDRALVAMDAARAEGVVFVVPDTFEDHVASAHASGTCIPALYAESHADLAGVGALLSVQAERRALVLCPRAPIALPFFSPMSDAASRELGIACRDGIHLVVIIPPPEARKCGACNRRGYVESSADAYGIARCSECNGSGRIEPWPMHPAWVRSIVERCRAAGVLCVDMTPRVCERCGGAGDIHSGDVFGRVFDYECSSCNGTGHLLDGADAMDLPDWIV